MVILDTCLIENPVRNPFNCFILYYFTPSHYKGSGRINPDKYTTVIHIRHNSEPGGEINDIVKPLPSEKIFSKDAVNCFVGTDLLDFLKTNKIDTLVICGMQTQMCVEAATRAASDYGFKCILIHDACATKDLKFGDKIIKAEDVHYSTLSTLKNYAQVISTKEYLNK